MIIERLEVGPFASNCYIVGSETTREAMVIDPGADGADILKTVNKLGLTVKTIVLTHGHMDHVGALKPVKDATGAQLAVHADEARTLSRGAAGVFGLASPATPLPDRLLKGGDTIEVGELRFMVLHTPGHSPGGICLVGHGVAFTGDTLFNFGIGRTDFPGCSQTQLMNSIHTKLMVLPDTTAVYPGHGPESTIGAERRWNPFLRE